MFSPSFIPHIACKPGDELYSDHMLFELLSTHEQFIGQLRLHGLKGADAAHRTTDMIERHEQTAARLRAHIQCLGRKLPAATPALTEAI